MMGQPPNTAGMAQQIMQAPIPGQTGAHPGVHHPQQMMIPQQDRGYGQYMATEEDGLYEGVEAQDDEFIDPGFEDYEEEEEEDEYIIRENPHMAPVYPHGFPEPARPAPVPKRRTSAPSATGSNPLDGMSPEQVGAYFEKWMETQDKGRVRAVAIGIAGKVMK